MLFSLILAVFILPFMKDATPPPKPKVEEITKVCLIYDASYIEDLNLWIPFWEPPTPPGTIIDVGDQRPGCVYSAQFRDKKGRICSAYWLFERWDWDEDFESRSMVITNIVIFKDDGNVTDTR